MIKQDFKNLRFLYAILFLGLGVITISCGGGDSDDEEPPVVIDCTGSDPSYMADILPIVEATCSLEACHAANTNQADYTTYEGLKAQIDNGRVQERVLQEMDMPPDYSNGPQMLTDDQLKQFTCWIEDGAPNN